jgi:hypothetical protein
MTETPANQLAPQPGEGEPEDVAFEPIRARWLVLVGSPCAAIVVAITSLDWCSTTVHSILISALLISFLDAYLWREAALTWPWGRKVQIAGVAVVIAFLGFLFRIDAKDVFERAFGMPPPVGVRDLTVDSNLRLVDTTQLLRFTADQATIIQITAAPRFRIVRETTQGYPEPPNWGSIWSRVFSAVGGQGGPAWKKVEPMKKPIHFIMEDAHSPWTANVLWDADSGRTYVEYGTF